MKRKPDPLLRTMPWKVTMVFGPLERILHRLEMDGTVDTAGLQVVFKEDSKGGWYDMVEALRGVIEFHRLAASRHGLPVDVHPMERFATKLDKASTIFESDIAAVRACIEACKSVLMRLRLSQAVDIVNTIRISMEFDKINGRKAA